MFTPKYLLTSKLLGSIAETERLYGRLESLRIPRKLQLNLERDNLIQSSYISNSVEGNPLSLPEVTNLILDDRVPVNRDEKEVRNYFEILSGLDSCAEGPLTLEVVGALHRELLSGVDDSIAGRVRNKRVVVGGYREVGGERVLEIRHEPPFHRRDQLKKALVELLSWVEREKDLPVVVKAGIFHHQFVFLHPFVDGNGRTCRLLSALLFLRDGYLINKHFVLDDYYDVDRFLYSDKLHSADAGDKTEWLEYFSDGVKYSLQSALAKFERAVDELGSAERLSPREGEVLQIVKDKKEITSAQLAKILAVSRQQAHSLLKRLLEKDFIDKKGKTKGSYYLIK